MQGRDSIYTIKLLLGGVVSGLLFSALAIYGGVFSEGQYLTFFYGAALLFAATVGGLLIGGKKLSVYLVALSTLFVSLGVLNLTSSIVVLNRVSYVIYMAVLSAGLMWVINKIVGDRKKIAICGVACALVVYIILSLIGLYLARNSSVV